MAEGSKQKFMTDCWTRMWHIPGCKGAAKLLHEVLKSTMPTVDAQLMQLVTPSCLKASILN